jgi:hypothetical protein
VRGHPSYKTTFSSPYERRTVVFEEYLASIGYFMMANVLLLVMWRVD